MVNPTGGSGSSSSSAHMTSPTTPKRVWKAPAKTGDSVLSMFAHATLTKPLKVNAVVTSTIVRRKQQLKQDQDQCDEAKKTSTVPQTSPKPAAIATNKTAKPVMTATKTPAATGTASAPSSSSSTLKHNRTLSKTKTSSDNPAMVLGGSSTVAGTPMSWPKPHAVPPEVKSQVLARSSHHQKKKSAASAPAASPSSHYASSTPASSPTPINIAKVTPQQKFHKDIDHLIPEMYRKKSAAQLEQEQQDEIQMMRRIMWELKRLEIEKEEQELQIKPITPDVEATLRALKNAKKERDMIDDHSSLDDSDATSKRMSAYSAHMRSKLAFFNSHHSAKLYDNNEDDSDDSSSISSWDSDASDGLFRG